MTASVHFPRFPRVNRLPASPLVTRAIDVAVKRLGMKELSERLGSPESSIEAWRMGHATMPEYKFLKLVDILTDLVIDWDEWNPKE